ncbi:hypothetical protein EXIGLDRAFT_441681 [Exidia glandulosa HHB12029]|uniref:Zn(2)-C6 fungal-type domain-containing protein n=1 Tax=Exidia glandulosa HHB12029 TaxID=1314781 RepID=A0A165KB37_EXIGL|nr:hypothetical protein EXIGLDRAFT_441681 [Exidia glandulosa HHB12029]
MSTSKFRCDGAPFCGTCVRRQIPCQYSRSQLKRRPLTYKPEEHWHASIHRDNASAPSNIQPETSDSSNTYSERTPDVPLPYGSVTSVGPLGNLDFSDMNLPVMDPETWWRQFDLRPDRPHVMIHRYGHSQLLTVSR